MDFEQQQKEAAARYHMTNQAQGGPGAAIPRPSTVSGMVREALDAPQCSRENMKQELASKIIRSQVNAGEMTRLTRLAELADKHPETFEMLQLMRDTGLWY